MTTNCCWQKKSRGLSFAASSCLVFARARRTYHTRGLSFGRCVNILFGKPTNGRLQLIVDFFHQIGPAPPSAPPAAGDASRTDVPQNKTKTTHAYLSCIMHYPHHHSITRYSSHAIHHTSNTIHHASRIMFSAGRHNAHQTHSPFNRRTHRRRPPLPRS